MVRAVRGALFEGGVDVERRGARDDCGPCRCALNKESLVFIA
jgi:hypothetical protein